MAATPGLPPPTPAEVSEDKRPVIIHVTVWLHVLSTLCLLLRLASRKVKTMRLGVDDWFIVAAQIVGYGHAATIITSMLEPPETSYRQTIADSGQWLPMAQDSMQQSFS